MSAQAPATITGALRAAGPLALLGGGFRALGRVPGLNWLLVRGFLLLYGFMLFIGGGVYLMIYKLALEPLMGLATELEATEGFFDTVLAWLLTGVYYVSQFMTITACVVLALVLSITLMSVWFEVLSARIVAHLRGGAPPGGGFSLRAMVETIGRAILDNIRLILLALLALLLGLIPVVGILLVFVITCYLLGHEVREPYLAVRESYGEDPKALREGMGAWTLRAGILPTLIALIPWLGWMLVPALMIFLVAGASWHGENGGGGEART